MTEIAHRNQGSDEIQTRINQAKVMAEASLLPKQYQRNPANIYVAMEYGNALGIHPMIAINEVNVINGTPALSASLMASLARNAGHKVRVSGDADRAVCQIVRSDDPDYTHEAVWDVAKAKAAGLWGRGHWAKDPGTMLRWRAIAECVRFACSEVLGGLKYTPEEVADFTAPAPAQARKQGGYGITANMPTPAPRPEDVVEVTHEEQPEPEALVFASRSQQTRLGKALDGIGVTENTEKAAEVQRWASEQGITRDVTKSGHLTVDEIETMITWLESMAPTDATEPVMEWDTQEVPS